MKKTLPAAILLAFYLLSCSSAGESPESVQPVSQPVPVSPSAEPAARTGEDYRTAYLDLMDREEYEDLSALLEDWEKDFPKDPEMFIAWFNYYLNRNVSSGMSLQENPPPSGEHLAITDPDTGEIMGYMCDSTTYDPEDTGMAIARLNRGLALAPDRLDMHFGKIHILQEIGDYATEAEALMACLSRSAENGNAWLWSRNEPLEEGFSFLVNNIQDYYSLWLNVGSDETLDALKEVSSLQMDLYPDHVYAYNNIAFSFLLRGSLEEGLAYLLQAEELNPDDVIVLNNIALCYVNLDDRESARRYFERLLDYPDEVERAYVEERLKNL